MFTCTKFGDVQGCPSRRRRTPCKRRGRAALEEQPPSAVSAGAVWVAGSILGGAAGTPFVVKATNSWYSDPTVLKLPSWTPPNKVFMPVWTVLYGLIGLTGYRAPK